jgi:hypothetical protein
MDGVENIDLPEGEDVFEGYDKGSEEENEKDKEEKNNIPNLQEVKTDEHYAIIDKIRGYKKTFANECSAVDVKKIDRMSLPELIRKLEECKAATADRPGAQIHKVAFKAVLSGTEIYVAPALNLDLRGFSKTAMDDDELMKTLDEIALLQDWSTKNIPPEQRLVLGLGMLAMKINGHNKREAKRLSMPENIDEYDDV